MDDRRRDGGGVPGGGPGVVAGVVGAVRPAPEEQATRAYLARALVQHPLTFKDAVVVDAAGVGIDALTGAHLADVLTALLIRQLRLASAHYDLSSSARQRDRTTFVGQEQQHAAQVTAALGSWGTPAFRADTLTMWLHDSRAPMRWFPAPTLGEIQERVYPAGIALVKETHNQREAQVKRMATRSGRDPQVVAALIAPLVLQREQLMERFGTAPAEELADLEQEMKQIVARGREALRAAVPADYVDAITAVAFIELADSQQGEPGIDETR